MTAVEIENDEVDGKGDSKVTKNLPKAKKMNHFTKLFKSREHSR